MISGDPFKFAVICDKVPEWNTDDTFNNGIMLISADGYIFPQDEIINITLSCAVREFIHSLENIPENKILYEEKDKNILFKKIYEICYSDDENFSGYNISPTEFLDNDIYIFAVKRADKIRVLISHATYDRENGRAVLGGITVREALININLIDIIISGLNQLNY